MVRFAEIAATAKEVYRLLTLSTTSSPSFTTFRNKTFMQQLISIIFIQLSSSLFFSFLQISYTIQLLTPRHKENHVALVARAERERPRT